MVSRPAGSSFPVHSAVIVPVSICVFVWETQHRLFVPVSLRSYLFLGLNAVLTGSKQTVACGHGYYTSTLSLSKTEIKKKRRIEWLTDRLTNWMNEWMNDKKQRRDVNQYTNQVVATTRTAVCVRVPCCPANPTQTPALKASRCWTSTSNNYRHIERKHISVEKGTKDWERKYRIGFLQNFANPNSCNAVLIFRKILLQAHVLKCLYALMNKCPYVYH